tara:strand:- start:1580 stop:1744 length:165 start_codon:yes stop_codon:yes gene_type:complete
MNKENVIKLLKMKKVLKKKNIKDVIKDLIITFKRKEFDDNISIKNILILKRCTQ